MSANKINKSVTVKEIGGNLVLSEMLYTPSSHREHRMTLDVDAEERLLSILLSRKASRNSSVETLFSVQFVASSAATDAVTVQLVNPDGSVCVANEFVSGTYGFTLGTEAQIAEWVGVQAEDYVVTHFDAVAEQSGLRYT